MEHWAEGGPAHRGQELPGGSEMLSTAEGEEEEGRQSSSRQEGWEGLRGPVEAEVVYS